MNLQRLGLFNRPFFRTLESSSQLPLMWRRALFKKSVLCLFIGWMGGLSAVLAQEQQIPPQITESVPAVAPVPPEVSPVLQVIEGQGNQCAPLKTTFSDQDWSALYRLYQGQGFGMLWSSSSALQTLLEQLKLLADDGLEPQNYALDMIRDVLRLEQPLTACSDVQISHGYLQALQHLAVGRLEQSKFEPLWYAEGSARDALETVLALAESGLADPKHAFEQARPNLDLYQNLRKLYVKLRHAKPSSAKPIPAGPVLKPGMEDERVVLIDRALRNAGYAKAGLLPKDSWLYSDAMAEAVARFQRQNGLQADGLFGETTRAALSVGSISRLEQLRINLERLRWIAHDMEPNILLVDVAGARVIYYQDNRPVWSTRAQVGQPERATPLLKSTITRVTLNPTWTVPPTILKEDKLPKIRQNAQYLKQHRLQVFDSQGQLLDPNQVNWSSPQGIRLRQEAGEGNPLGQVAIRFANPFAVYLHDTPSRHLFSRSSRAFSSGCVRVEGALRLVDRLLSDDEERGRVSQLIDTGKTHQYRLSKPIPVLMAYWTAEADSKGQPQYRPDIYQKDQALLAALLSRAQ